MSADPNARDATGPAARDALLRAMDLNCWEMYRDIARRCAGAELVETPAYSMLWGPRAGAFQNALMVHAPCDAGELAAAAERFYAGRPPYSIWVRAHADAAVERALRARGYTTHTTLPGMALIADPGTRCAPPGLEVRAARDDRGREAFRDVSAAAYATYGSPPEYAADAFAQLESVCASHIQGFVGYLGEEPVAAAAVYVTHGVAGIGWVGCVPAARGHRYAEAVTWAALREGLRRGGAFANLQASPMGRPVYERMGFRTFTEYRVLAQAGHS
ncbi:MAG: GNAT family N-acetyltransferase [Candidatus Binatia bacterium]